MKDGLKVFCAIMAGLVLVLGVTWIIQGNNFFLRKVFGPAQADVDRETFEHTRSFIKGTIDELESMRFQYVKADEAHKTALADVILRRAASISEEHLPFDLRQFIAELRRERLR